MSTIFLSHSAAGNQAVFSSRSRWLLTAGRDGSARAWMLPNAGLIGQSCGRVMPNLPTAEWRRRLGGQPFQALRADLPADDP